MDKVVLKPQCGAKAERRQCQCIRKLPPSHCPRWRLPGSCRRQFKGRAEPHGREGAIGRRPSWTRKWQSPGPGRHRLSGRERILAETLHQRGNRVVTNKQFGRWSYACSQLGTHAVRNSYRCRVLSRQSKTRAHEAPCVPLIFPPESGHWSRRVLLLAGTVLTGVNDEGRHV